MKTYLVVVQNSQGLFLEVREIVRGKTTGILRDFPIVRHKVSKKESLHLVKRLAQHM